MNGKGNIIVVGSYLILGSGEPQPYIASILLQHGCNNDGDG